MKKSLAAILLSALFTISFACTSAIISGSVTEDGRPLLWKHRDTGSLENQLLYIESDPYNFIGVVNAEDTLRENVWMGVNDAGFSIMNTASYNINTDTICLVDDDEEGEFMRLALEICATVDDFETLLKSESGKWGIAANFGVIDAEGNGAYFEAGYYTYTKFDVNDPAVAPGGYLIRTNFSFTGDDEHGQGYLRFKEASDVFSRQTIFNEGFLVGKMARHLGHSAISYDIESMKRPKCFKDTTLAAFQDYIVRYWSASDLIVKGVLKGQDADETILYPIMGFSLTTLVTPVYYSFKETLPSIVQNQDGLAPELAKASLALKATCFPVEHEDHENYIDVCRLKNKFRVGYLDKIPTFETVIMRKFGKMSPDSEQGDVEKYINWLDNYIIGFYRGYEISY